MSKMFSRNIELITSAKHFLYDYDGTIVDSIDMHRKAFDLLFEDLGLDYNFFEITGLDTRAAIYQVLKKNKKKVGQIEFEDFVIKKRKYASEVFDQLSLKSGICTFLKRFWGRSPGAICSNSSEKTINKGLARFSLTDYFEIVYGAESVLHCKPFPDVYLKAIDYFGCSPSDCVVFEDTDIGVQAAKAAGCNVIDVRLMSFEVVIAELDFQEQTL